ncbi:MAG: hypothetical protein LBQ66_06145 [Planctomycetaceae bacterium]|nr:hypothetical protein [Planctomycetaceae bacterium]
MFARKKCPVGRIVYNKKKFCTNARRQWGRFTCWFTNTPPSAIADNSESLKLLPSSLISIA